MSIFKKQNSVETITNEGELEIVSGSGVYQVKRRFGKGDLIALILSVIAAVFLWFFVMSVESPTTEMNFFGVTVKTENDYAMQTEHGWSLLSDDSFTVDVVLRGKKATLNRMTSEDISAFVDLSKVQNVGKNELQVEFNLPKGITLVSGHYVTVEVDSVKQKSVPVIVSLTNYSFESEYEIGEMSTSHQQLDVTGPESVVNSVAMAKVILDMGNTKLNESFSASVTPILCDENGYTISSNYLSTSESTVTVRIPVWQYKDVPLTVSYKYGLFNDENVNVGIEPATIRVKGDPFDVKRLDKLELAVIDEKTVSSDFSSVYSVVLPENVVSVDGIESASVNLKHIGTSTKTLTVKDITVLGGEGKNYNLLTKSLDISFRCNTDRINSFDSSCITATIDLSSVGELVGQIDKKVTVNVTDEFNGIAYVLNEYSVIVEMLPAEEDLPLNK